MLRARPVLPLATLAAWGVFGCGNPPPGAAPSLLTLSVTPGGGQVDNQGSTTTLFAVATNSDGSAGVGSVTFSATAGTLNGSHVPQTVILDASGTARVTFACNQSQDPACTSDATISAVWGSIHTSPVVVTIISSGIDAGPGPDAGATPDAGSPRDAGPIIIFDAGPSNAVAYQIDVAHTGNQTADALTPPLTQSWAVDLGGPTSYPLIVDGIVLVTVGNVIGGGTTLHALDLQSGAERWPPIALPGTTFWSGLCYDNGAVFTVTFDGVVRAFELLTGAQRWVTTLPGGAFYSSPPTAANGSLYVVGAGSLFALDETIGGQIWQSPAGGDNSSPAIAGDSVFVSFSCEQVFAVDAVNATMQWHHTSSCSGGGGRTPAVSGNRVYARDFVLGNVVLDAANGNALGTFDAGPIPAFADAGVGYFLSGTTLSAQSVGTGSTLWTFTGDGALVTAPIVVNGFVYVGSSNGKLFAVEPIGGTAVWSVTLDGGISAPDEQNLSQPLTGLAAAQNTLVVPVGSLLVAFQ